MLSGTKKLINKVRKRLSKEKEGNRLLRERIKEETEIKSNLSLREATEEETELGIHSHQIRAIINNITEIGKIMGEGEEITGIMVIIDIIIARGDIEMMGDTEMMGDIEMRDPVIIITVEENEDGNKNNTLKDGEMADITQGMMITMKKGITMIKNMGGKMKEIIITGIIIGKADSQNQNKKNTLKSPDSLKEKMNQSTLLPLPLHQHLQKKCKKRRLL